jgi:hypothetical protein
LNPCLFPVLETGGGDRDGIDAARQRGNSEISVSVADRDVRYQGSFVGSGYFRIDEYRSGLIDNDACKSAAELSERARRRHEEHEQCESYKKSCSFVFV